MYLLPINLFYFWKASQSSTCIPSPSDSLRFEPGSPSPAPVSPQPVVLPPHLSKSPEPYPNSPRALPQSPNTPPAQLSLPEIRCLINYQRRPCPIVDINTLSHSARLQPMKDTMNFIWALASASTADLVTKLQPNAFHQLHVPPNSPLIVSSPGIRHSISTYLALKHSS